MQKISAIVLTKNEEKNVVDCLDTLSFCDEIIIIDDYSTDRTWEIIEKVSKEDKRIKSHKRALNLNFSEQRKFGIEQASNDLILFLDADERVSKELKSEIENLLDIDTKYSGFLIPRIDFMWGKKLAHGETGNIKLLRLFNKKDGKLKGKVHETWVTERPVTTLINPIMHYPHPTISEFLREINFYTDLRAEELYEQKKRVNLISIIFYPLAKFFVNYIFKLGILDGTAGLVHAIMMSFHSFLVRGKLWQLWQKKVI